MASANHWTAIAYLRWIGRINNQQELPLVHGTGHFRTNMLEYSKEKNPNMPKIADYEIGNYQKN
jgi:hypothetical protein